MHVRIFKMKATLGFWMKAAIMDLILATLATSMYSRYLNLVEVCLLPIYRPLHVS